MRRGRPRAPADNPRAGRERAPPRTDRRARAAVGRSKRPAQLHPPTRRPARGRELHRQRGASGPRGSAARPLVRPVDVGRGAAPVRARRRRGKPDPLRPDGGFDHRPPAHDLRPPEAAPAIPAARQGLRGVRAGRELPHHLARLSRDAARPRLAPALSRPRGAEGRAVPSASALDAHRGAPSAAVGSPLASAGRRAERPGGGRGRRARPSCAPRTGGARRPPKRAIREPRRPVRRSRRRLRARLGAPRAAARGALRDRLRSTGAMPGRTPARGALPAASPRRSHRARGQGRESARAGDLRAVPRGGPDRGGAPGGCAPERRRPE